jgi:hypothetical protein
VGTYRYAVFRWHDRGSVCLRREGVSQVFVDAVGRSGGDQAALAPLQRGKPVLLGEPGCAEQAAVWREEGIGGAFLLPLRREGRLEGLVAMYFDRSVAIDATAARILTAILTPVLDAEWFEAERAPLRGSAGPEALLTLMQQEFQPRLQAVTAAIGVGRRALLQLRDPQATLGIRCPLELAEWHTQVLSRMLGDVAIGVGDDPPEPAIVAQPHLLTRLLPAIVERLRPYAGDRTLRVSAPNGDALRAAVDPMWLEVAMGHLISDAARTCPGGAPIGIELLRGHRPAGPDCAVIAVAHQTVMPEATATSKDRPSLDPASQRRGLALDLARKGAEAQGGMVWVYGPDERGITTSCLALPLVEPALD